MQGKEETQRPGSSQSRVLSLLHAGCPGTWASLSTSSPQPSFSPFSFSYVSPRLYQSLATRILINTHPLTLPHELTDSFTDSFISLKIRHDSRESCCMLVSKNMEMTDIKAKLASTGPQIKRLNWNTIINQHPRTVGTRGKDTLGSAGLVLMQSHGHII